MKTIYMVCENVDLGFHVEGAYTSEEKAEQVCAELNKRHIDLHVNALVKNCGYTVEQARDCATDLYFVQGVELNDE